MKYIKTYEAAINGITFNDWLKSNPQDIDITKLDASDENLIDLNGIEQFTNLQRLICNSNKLTFLPDLSNLTNLKVLYCDNNQLPYKDLEGYLEWHKKEYPWFWDAKKYNL